MKSFKTALQALVILFFISFIFQAQAQIYVKWDAPGTNDGSSWTNAYTDLQSALSVANSGQEIWVAKGPYKPTSGADRTLAFSIPSGVEVYGGFDGSESNLIERDYENNLTKLSGDIGTANVSSDNSYTIVKLFQVSSATILDGFTLDDGYADGVNLTNRSGGAVFVNGATTGISSSPKIRNCIFSNNYAVSGGGAIYIDGSSSGTAAPVFENCQFNDNDADADGGAIYNSGISNGSCTPEFVKCTFKSNYSIGSGGAMFNHGGTGNSSPIFKECDFESNTAESNGGAMYNLGNNGNSSPEYHNCRFYKNEGFAAGGIYNLGSNSGNSSPDIINCTFVGNEATGAGGTGGAIYNNASAGGTSSPIVANCIIWGNIAPYGSHVFRNVDGTPTISYSIVDVADCASLNSGAGSNVTCGSGMIYNVDPLFLNEAGGNLHLDDLSQAIDAGDNDKVTEMEDLDGNTRIQEVVVDMGAYEDAPGPLPIELLEFSAVNKSGQVELNWLTLSEDKNDFFTIERSADGKDFEKLFTVNGAGTTNLAHSYKELDRNPLAGFNYYRLKQTDFDGKYSFSAIQVVETTSGRIAAFPNPAKDYLHLSLSGFENSSTEVAIYNLFGELVYRGHTEVNSKLSTIHLSEVAAFTPGIYVVHAFMANGASFTCKFEKIGE